MYKYNNFIDNELHAGDYNYPLKNTWTNNYWSGHTGGEYYIRGGYKDKNPLIEPFEGNEGVTITKLKNNFAFEKLFSRLTSLLKLINL
jgi:hypothetical protein